MFIICFHDKMPLRKDRRMWRAVRSVTSGRAAKGAGRQGHGDNERPETKATPHCLPKGVCRWGRGHIKHRYSGRKRRHPACLSFEMTLFRNPSMIRS